MSLRIIIGLQTEKRIPEDASAHGEHYAFVFDGLGGTGGGKLPSDEGVRTSEAKIASSAAAEALDALMEEKWSEWYADLDFSSGEALEERVSRIVEEDIAGALKAGLQAAARKWHAQKLPTTVAGWLTFPLPDGKTLAAAVWAGDSRCYAIDGQHMKLYSRDDVRPDMRRDAMEDCLDDSQTMNNRLGLDKAFTLNHSCHVFEGPILLFACSDGFYNCSESPMHFEYYLRQLGAYDSFESMAENWTEFQVPDRFQDDSTLESIFINRDPEDVEALCELLLSDRAEELKEKYIEVYPVEDDRLTYSDIDSSIGRLAKKLCQENDPYQFIAALRENVVSLAKSGAAVPDKLPCAPVIRAMREDYQGKKREQEQKRTDRLTRLENEKRQAEQALERCIGEARKWEFSCEVRPEPLTGDTQKILNQCASDKSRGAIARHALYDHFARLAAFLSNYALLLRSEERNSYRSWGDMRSAMIPLLSKARFPREPVEEDTIRSMNELLIDLAGTMKAAAAFEDHPDLGGKIVAGTVEARRSLQKLSDTEQQRLKTLLLEAAQSGEQPNLDAMKNVMVYTPDMIRVISAAVKYINASKNLDAVSRTADPAPQPSAAPFEEYLILHRNSDARYIAESWMESGEQPRMFRFPEELTRLLEKNINVLRQMKANNAAIVRNVEEVRKARMELWYTYKPAFEAFDEPFEYTPAHAQPVDFDLEEPEPEPPAEVLKAEAGEETPSKEAGEAAAEKPAEAGEKTPSEGAGEAAAEKPADAGEETPTEEAGESPAEKAEETPSETDGEAVPPKDE